MVVTDEQDVVADLNVESFASAYVSSWLCRCSIAKTKDALAALRAKGSTPDLYTGSPCLFCLQSFGKIPWHKGAPLDGILSNNGWLPVDAVVVDGRPGLRWMEMADVSLDGAVFSTNS